MSENDIKKLPFDISLKRQLFGGKHLTSTEHWNYLIKTKINKHTTSIDY